jgi:hypothetical protein
MPSGICKLCLLTKDLRDSHLMPRSLYKKSRGSGIQGNQDPVLVTKDAEKRSSYQITDYVFCGDCEHRLNVNGEQYVLGLVARQNLDFPLLDLLQAATPTAKHAHGETYSAADTPAIDRDKIAYFGLSVFWRASVHTWKLENGNKVKVHLGPKYNEELRQYLMGLTAVPKNVSLQLVVCSDALNRGLFFAPAENQKIKDRTFIFVARGMQFYFRVSNTLKDFDEAEAVYKQAEERKLESETLLLNRYQLAFLKGDTTQMAQLASAGMGKPGTEEVHRPSRSSRKLSVGCTGPVGTSSRLRDARRHRQSPCRVSRVPHALERCGCRCPRFHSGES